jgi:hypothetical protein
VLNSRNTRINLSWATSHPILSECTVLAFKHKVTVLLIGGRFMDDPTAGWAPTTLVTTGFVGSFQVLLRDTTV